MYANSPYEGGRGMFLRFYTPLPPSRGEVVIYVKFRLSVQFNCTIGRVNLNKCSGGFLFPDYSFNGG